MEQDGLPQAVNSDFWSPRRRKDQSVLQKGVPISELGLWTSDGTDNRDGNSRGVRRSCGNPRPRCPHAQPWPQPSRRAQPCGARLCHSLTLFLHPEGREETLRPWSSLGVGQKRVASTPCCWWGQSAVAIDL